MVSLFYCDYILHSVPALLELGLYNPEVTLKTTVTTAATVTGIDCLTLPLAFYFAVLGGQKRNQCPGIPMRGLG